MQFFASFSLIVSELFASNDDCPLVVIGRVVEDPNGVIDALTSERQQMNADTIAYVTDCAVVRNS